MWSELFGVLDRPVFLTGCGRSGTTILGTALSHHHAITYLNEPRHLWIRAYPETDIWSPRAAERRGVLVLTAADCRLERSWRLRRLFARETRATGRPRLLEKLPINSFRLEFIRRIFPNALFLHIVRDGREVAASIARECEAGRWFGESDYKWRLLVRFAEADQRTASLPALCRTEYERGLLEWRLSVETARRFYATVRGGRHLELRYEDLLADPPAMLARIERFLGVAPDPAVHAFGRDTVARRSPPAAAATDADLRIAGDLLATLGYVRWSALDPLPPDP
ncbi:MAG TPA: sulfotransferase [Candidatus Binatia bacterium]|nr:sulfotransferase [Candidatus Binatia bacterium]